MSNTRISERPYLVPGKPIPNNFDFMRIAMAILVVWSHSFAIYYGSEANEPVSLILNGVYNSGNIAVRVFFCISGFLVSASFVKSSSSISYFSKRIKRIVPGFLVCIIICSFVVIPAMSSTVDLSVFQISKTMANALVLRSEFPPSDAFYANPVTAVNGALWSIPFEFWCYIGIAVLGTARVLKNGLIILAITVSIILARIFLDILGITPGFGIVGDIIGWPYLWTAIAPCFLSGVLVYLYGDKIPRRRSMLAVIVVSLVISAHVSKILTEALLPLSLAYVTFYFAFSSTKLPDAKRGDFSYGTYLYGFPIQQMLITASLPFWLYVPSAILMSVFAGMLSWFLVERHFLPASRASHPADATNSPIIAQPSTAA